MTTKTPTIPAPVHAGAGWLDITDPGWADRLDPDDVIAWHPYYNVLWLLYGTDAMPPLTIDERIKLGFEAAGQGLTEVEATARMAEWDLLTNGWQALIEARRG